MFTFSDGLVRWRQFSRIVHHECKSVHEGKNINEKSAKTVHKGKKNTHKGKKVHKVLKMSDGATPLLRYFFFEINHIFLNAHISI